MNVNQDYKDFTQYSIKSSEILANIFETINKFTTCNNDNEKDQIYSELSENITNFELTLDNCSIDINEAVARLIKDRNEKKVNNNNSNNENDNQGNRLNTDAQISDEQLIDNLIEKIKKIKLNI